MARHGNILSLSGENSATEYGISRWLDISYFTNAYMGRNNLWETMDINNTTVTIKRVVIVT
jgi:hypothetical protein